jgi:hypothetical protein
LSVRVLYRRDVICWKCSLNESQNYCERRARKRINRWVHNWVVWY